MGVLLPYESNVISEMSPCASRGKKIKTVGNATKESSGLMVNILDLCTLGYKITRTNL